MSFFAKDKDKTITIQIKMNPSLSRDDSEDEPARKVDYKLDDFEMVKTIGTGMEIVEIVVVIFHPPPGNFISQSLKVWETPNVIKQGLGRKPIVYDGYEGLPVLCIMDMKD